MVFEVNFDGLVGPTHNYAGLSFGNIASQLHQGAISYPKQAARQGLQKMKFLHDMGLKQAILPPLCRPYIALLAELGFTGSARDMLVKAANTYPQILPYIYSASSMWTANAATVSPSADTEDGKLHITPANLVSNLHRWLESKDTANLLAAIFADEQYFVHHAPLPSQPEFGDEGAANFMRLVASHGDVGVEILVYGEKTCKYPARQTKLACETVLRRHGVKRSLVVAQNPEVIDAGVFHNDVIAVANENVLFYHEHAFADEDDLFAELGQLLEQKICKLRVSAAEVSVRDAVSSYLFNSQLITLPNSGGKMAIIAPQESRDNERVYAMLQRLQQDSSNPVTQLHFMDLRESMQNGGGPACLRLRVVMTGEEFAAMHVGVKFSDDLYNILMQWVDKHYRDCIKPEDLADPQLMEESFVAQSELIEILNLHNRYEPEALRWS